VKKYIWNILIAIDQLGNALLNGHPDETISSRLGKKRIMNKEKWHHRLISKALNRLDKRHVEKAIERDRGKNVDDYIK